MLRQAHPSEYPDGCACRFFVWHELPRLFVKPSAAPCLRALCRGGKTWGENRGCNPSCVRSSRRCFAPPQDDRFVVGWIAIPRSSRKTRRGNRACPSERNGAERENQPLFDMQPRNDCNRSPRRAFRPPRDDRSGRARRDTIPVGASHLLGMTEQLLFVN